MSIYSIAVMYTPKFKEQAEKLLDDINTQTIESAVKYECFAVNNDNYKDKEIKEKFEKANIVLVCYSNDIAKVEYSWIDCNIIKAFDNDKLIGLTMEEITAELNCKSQVSLVQNIEYSNPNYLRLLIRGFNQKCTPLIERVAVKKPKHLSKKTKKNILIASLAILLIISSVLGISVYKNTVDKRYSVDYSIVPNNKDLITEYTYKDYIYIYRQIINHNDLKKLPKKETIIFENVRVKDLDTVFIPQTVKNIVFNKAFIGCEDLYKILKKASSDNLSVSITNSEIIGSYNKLPKEKIKVWYLGLKNCRVEDWRILDTIDNDIHDLRIIECHLQDLKNMARFENLINIFINNNPVSDASDLKNLKKIEYFDMGNTKISDISFLESSAQVIQSLDISNCPIDMQKIPDEFPSLIQFSANSCGITNLDMLAESKNIEYISVKNNPIKSIEPLQYKKNITTLILNNCEVNDFSFIYSSRNKITYLDVANNRINLFPTYLPALEILNVSNTDVNYLDFFCNYSNLEKLYCYNLGLKNLNGIEKLSKLTELYTSNNEISDLSALQRSNAHLEVLCIDNNNISNIDVLKKFDLKYIDISNNKITSLQPLKSNLNLENIRASSNRIKDTRGIEGLENLYYLDLSNNCLSEIGVEKPLKFSDKYYLNIYLDNNNIKSINNIDLNKNSVIEEFSLNGNDLNDYSLLYPLHIERLAVDYDTNIEFKKLTNIKDTLYVATYNSDKQENVKQNFRGKAKIVFSADAY